MFRSITVARCVAASTAFRCPSSLRIAPMALSQSLSQTLRSYSTRKYTADHEWVKVDGKVATIGISEYAQKALGDVVYVEVPEVGSLLKRKDVLSAVESVKAASDVYTPVTGTVLEVNTNLADEPSLINKSPYAEGWIAKIEMSDSTQLNELMDEKAYAAHIE
ncbi:glycine cleavage system H-protein subunit [Batrachochytrium dendrobatidis]|nr:glycine cleavage system H-protein subunit [Batrachochytrium dendrobatidis]KAK5665268.1 glycine cleavage system H-protein subunit [Batrachochytrium dendrobatidis]